MPESPLRPYDLRCEHLTNTLAVDRLHPVLSWKLACPHGTGKLQSAYRILCEDAEKEVIWDSGKVPSDSTFGIPYTGPRRTGLRCHWRVQVWDEADQPSAWSAHAFFQFGLLQPGDWHARWIWIAPMECEQEENGRRRTLRGASYYRREFVLDQVPIQATAYLSAKGIADLHVNGHRVAEDLFTPGWTAYDKRICYRAYDVTTMLGVGANAIGTVLGDGWYSGYLGYANERCHYGEVPAVLVQLDLLFADGNRLVLASGEDWQASQGPIWQQDFLAGEDYDARREQEGWDCAGFHEDGWTSPQADPLDPGTLEAFPSQPVIPFEERLPISILAREDGYILDFGQNLAGFCRLRFIGEAGETVTLKFAEVLSPDGSLYTVNLRGARARDSYTFKGEGIEEWSPRFTFHGFRYVEVSGLEAPPDPESIVAVAISSATPEVGWLETSDPALNQLVRNAWWTQKMNFIDIPTDCPQRDERLGWTGDAQAYIETANMFSDNQAFFTKWLQSLDDGQREDGQYPMVAPLKVAGDDGGPAWADAGVICPRTMHQMYGDRRLLAERYPQMKRFVEFCRARSTHDLLPPETFHCFGDWLNIDAETPSDVIYTAYFALSTQLLASSAHSLGLDEDAEKYRNLAADVAAAFRQAFVSADGEVKGATQCAYVLALAFDLVREPLAGRVAEKLVADIEARDWHLSTGFVGTRDLMHVLSKIGRDDVAFKLLHQRTFPSWLFEIENGATTVWERWDGWTPERGFQDPGMNSFSHYAYGAVVGWMFKAIGGISSLAPGFGEILIAPKLDPHLTWAKCRYESPRGLIRSEWRVESECFHLEVEIPPNARAQVRLPEADEPIRVGSGIHIFSRKLNRTL